MEELDHQDPAETADVFGELARSLAAEGDLDAVLARLAGLAVVLIDGADHCGLTVVEGREVRTEGASDDVPCLVDRIQYETGQGPCLDAMRDHEVFEADDVATDPRWPEFGRRAADETPVRSMLAFRLFTAHSTLGALNLYAQRTGSFDEQDRHVGAVLAAHASVAMANARAVDSLKTALASRDVISTAKGMLMARGGITDDEAFTLLRRASQRTNTKLREVAERIVHGEEPPPATPGPSAP